MKVSKNSLLYPCDVLLKPENYENKILLILLIIWYIKCSKGLDASFLRS